MNNRGKRRITCTNSTQYFDKMYINNLYFRKAMKFTLPHILLSFAMLCILQLSCCKKKKPKDPITITYELGEVKDYMFFKQGTYWVYEHDMTGEIDSQYVTHAAISGSSTKGTEDWSEHITLIQETFSMRIRSNFKDGWGSVNYFDIYSNGQRVNAYPYPKKAYVFKRTKVPNIIKGPSTGDVFGFPYYTSPAKTVYQDSLIINYQLKGVTYDTVRVFVVGSGESIMQEPSLRTFGGGAKVYYAKGVGVIKVYQDTYAANNIPMKHSWNLIRKKIIQ